MPETAMNQDTAHKSALLLVDDDPLIAESLGFMLGQRYDVVTADTREAAKRQVEALPQCPDIALIDLGLPPLPHKPEEGFELIKELINKNPSMKILVLSGQDNDVNIQHALTLGAVDFIAKPADPNLLLSRLQHQQRLHAIETNRDTRAGTHLIGRSAGIEAVRNQIQQFADSPFPVLIEGESGTGKEMIAKALHENSKRNYEPYMVINCAAIAPDLLEAQLFGHRKGAFTGAEREHRGFFIEVGKGTLFLDEIGELPLELQSKLLRVLEAGEFYRIGETRVYQSQARIVAATNKVLSEEVSAGNFRTDLYHRLGILHIRMPPLRDRNSDKQLLLDHFQQLYADTVPPFTFDDKATQLWNSYTFPGNVRELRNIVIRLGTKYPGATVTSRQLNEELETKLSAETLSDQSPTLTDEYIVGKIEAGELRLDDLLSDIESRCIRLALEKYNNNISKAAEALHVNRTTLYSRVQKLGKN
ncbi:MAG: sigma-54-dependent Fis family transcriptional regulator [Gammaproteobacteria bacterium]|nr:sigma-54-dependent Fis family transcriptional regulator [Gammaproteobacteria bacterium]